VFAFLGGTWFPSATACSRTSGRPCPRTGWCRPAKVSIGGEIWDALGWLVMAAWTLVILLLAGRAYGRDTARV
jgi:hypothetical protein